MTDVIVGIDLGTTNSEVAALLDGTVQVLAGPDGEQIMPSCVSLAPDGALVVGTPARNPRSAARRRCASSSPRVSRSRTSRSSPITSRRASRLASARRRATASAGVTL